MNICDGRFPAHDFLSLSACGIGRRFSNASFPGSPSTWSTSRLGQLPEKLKGLAIAEHTRVAATGWKTAWLDSNRDRIEYPVWIRAICG
jgi:hypothetical protein